MLGHNGSTGAKNGKGASTISLLTIVGESARIEGKFEIADSIEIECEIGGELSVGRKLVISEKGGVFTGNVTKPGGGESKPVYRLEDKRIGSPATYVEAGR